MINTSMQANPFFTDLCTAFVSAGIPWAKLENPNFHNFLETYTTKSIPSESTLRKNYLPKVYSKVKTKSCVPQFFT
jgi:hypothetical protein